MKSLEHLVDISRIELLYACSEIVLLKESDATRSRILDHLYALGRSLELIQERCRVAANDRSIPDVPPEEVFGALRSRDVIPLASKRDRRSASVG